MAEEVRICRSAVKKALSEIEDTKKVCWQSVDVNARVVHAKVIDVISYERRKIAQRWNLWGDGSQIRVNP